MSKEFNEASTQIELRQKELEALREKRDALSKELEEIEALRKAKYAERNMEGQ
ncbi:MAG: hypothetical protein LBE35_00405 [Clostridiales bacterium]|nr:hypothetical protein [Clostridiales bacterium]